MPFQRVHSGTRAGVGQRELACCPSSHRAGVRPPARTPTWSAANPGPGWQSTGRAGRVTLPPKSQAYSSPILQRKQRLQEARSLCQLQRKLWRPLGSPAGAWGHSYRGLGPVWWMLLPKVALQGYRPTPGVVPAATAIREEKEGESKLENKK